MHIHIRKIHLDSQDDGGPLHERAEKEGKSRWAGMTWDSGCNFFPASKKTKQNKKQTTKLTTKTTTETKKIYLRQIWKMSATFKIQIYGHMPAPLYFWNMSQLTTWKMMCSFPASSTLPQTTEHHYLIFHCVWWSHFFTYWLIPKSLGLFK